MYVSQFTYLHPYLATSQPRSFEVFHFLHVPEIHDLATSFPLIQLHKTGSVESLKLFNACPYTEPTPAIPYVRLFF